MADFTHKKTIKTRCCDNFVSLPPLHKTDLKRLREKTWVSGSSLRRAGGSQPDDDDDDDDCPQCKRLKTEIVQLKKDVQEERAEHHRTVVGFVNDEDETLEAIFSRSFRKYCIYKQDDPVVHDFLSHLDEDLYELYAELQVKRPMTGMPKCPRSTPVFVHRNTEG